MYMCLFCMCVFGMVCVYLYVYIHTYVYVFVCIPYLSCVFACVQIIICCTYHVSWASNHSYMSGPQDLYHSSTAIHVHSVENISSNLQFTIKSLSLHELLLVVAGVGWRASGG